jgi:hypothetical protein
VAGADAFSHADGKGELEGENGEGDEGGLHADSLRTNISAEIADTLSAGRRQTANFRQTAPEIHVSPRIAGNSCQSPGCPKNE